MPGGFATFLFVMAFQMADKMVAAFANNCHGHHLDNDIVSLSTFKMKLE